MTDFHGHMTLADGSHVALTAEAAEAPWNQAERAAESRAMRMPGEQDALRALFDAYQRLKELGWREGMYTPRDGSHFRIIEAGSTGMFDCVCEGEWPDCTWTTFDKSDAYPSRHPPLLFRLYPDDEAKYKARMAEAAARFRAERESIPIPAREGVG